MLARLRTRLAILVCGMITVVGVATGVFASCDGNYCSVDTGDCSPLNATFQDSCCRPSTTGKHCMTCTRRYYFCAGATVPGSAYNCSGSGAACS